MHLKHLFWVLLSLISVQELLGQVANPGLAEQTDTATGAEVRLVGLLDVYYGYDFNEPQNNQRPYAVSSADHNRLSVNLAYLGVTYKKENLRARFIPAFGTYMNANYADEPGSLRFLHEANAGVRLSQKGEIWLDAGVIGSPYTHESAVSKDHFLYTRALAPEYVPYYLSGLKLSANAGKKVKLYAYVLNGWQVISDNNTYPAFGTQVEYRPGKRWLINLNTYAGNEERPGNLNQRWRYLLDAYIVFNPEGDVGFTASFYSGWQERLEMNVLRTYQWWQANAAVKFKIGQNDFMAMRLEYFRDPQMVMIRPITDTQGFAAGSSTLGYSRRIGQNAMARLEYRYFFSQSAIFLDGQNPISESHLLMSNLCFWF